MAQAEVAAATAVERAARDDERHRAREEAARAEREAPHVANLVRAEDRAASQDATPD
jgi:hypothetical protein